MQVLQREPENIEYILYRAKIFIINTDYIKASSMLDLYARSNKTSKDYLLLRAQMQRDWNKNTAAASATIQEALILYPEDSTVLLLAADLASQSGQKIGGMTALELAGLVRASVPDDPDMLRIVMTENMKLKNWQNAYDAGDKLRQLKSMNETAAVQFIDICLALGIIQEARKTVNELYVSGRESESMQEASVKVLIAEKNNSEALRVIQLILGAASPRLKSSILFERSRIASDEETKLADLRSSLTANPRNQNALLALYSYYFQKADYRKAQYYLKQVVALNPNDSSLLRLNSELDILLAGPVR